MSDNCNGNGISETNLEAKMPCSLGVLTPQHAAPLIQVVRTLNISLGGELIPGKKVIRSWEIRS